jgi:hypothetical protein
MRAFPGARVTRVGKGMQWNQKQIEALIDAAECASVYLDAISKTDIAKMDEAEWMILIETIVAGYLNKHTPF